MNWQAKLKRSWLESVGRHPFDISARLAVLAAHPDDETIGASSMLARCQNVSVIFLTDGAPQDTHLWPAGVRGERPQYAEIRRREAENALGHAGISPRQITWLGAVDQEAVFAIAELKTRLTDVLRELQPEFLVTHPYEGGHPDHDCAALVARTAVSEGPCDATMLEMTSYHAYDGRLVTGEFLRAGSEQEIVFELSAEERARKYKMLEEYASQKEVLNSFRIDHERFRAAPAYNFRRPPHAGKLWYECLGWKMTGERWRALAASARERELSCR